MKKLILLFCFLIVACPEIYSQFIEENFDYPPGDSLGAHDFVSFSGDSTNRLRVTAPGLEFPNYAGSGMGNATTLANEGQDAYKPLPVIVDTGNVYLSIMANVQTGRSGDYFIGFLSTTSLNNFTGRLYVKQASNGNLAFGISKTTAASGGIFYGDSVYAAGVTYLLVMKYSFVAGTLNDQVSLFVFSSSAPSTEPSPYVGPIGGTGADLPNLGRVAIRQGTSSSAANLRLDGVYLSNTYNNGVLPVELASFVYTVTARDVMLRWSTSAEINNSGFDIERSVVNGTWSKIGNVAGNGTITSPTSYSFKDRNLASGKYNYRLKQIDFNGNFAYYNLSNEVNVGIPNKFDLSQNYPNPFNPSTTINYDLAFDSKVSIKLFDMSGKEAGTLVNESKTAGYYSVSFNASGLSSGIYFYSIIANAGGNNFVSTKKMILVK